MKEETTESRRLSLEHLLLKGLRSPERRARVLEMMACPDPTEVHWWLSQCRADDEERALRVVRALRVLIGAGD